jgi:MFS family permease
MQTSSSVPAASGNNYSRLLWFFAIMYVAEGACQVSHINGLLHQPLAFFCNQVFGWDADKTAGFVSVLIIPWGLKPIFGLISDFFPLFGYRRKSYLVLVNAAAAVAFLMLSTLSAPGHMLLALAVTTIAMTASSTLSGALLVENGKTTHMTSRFQAQQGLWFGIASCISCVVGGLLCRYLTYSSAFHWAAALSALPPLVVALTAWFLIKEEKTKMNVAQFKATLRSMREALGSKALWVVALFLALWSFNPGFGHPLMFYMRKDLHFDQDMIGYLNAFYAAGSALGAFFFVKVMAGRMKVRRMVVISIISGAVAQLAFVLLSNPVNAAVLHLFMGATTSVALLTMHVMAANACPDKAEGFVYAAILSVSNISWNVSQTVGGYVYVHQFDHQLKPLIVMSAIATAACLLLVPFFKFADHRTGTDRPAEMAV